MAGGVKNGEFLGQNQATMAAWSWKLFMCHTISDYMEQHDVGPLLRSFWIGDSYIQGYFALFKTGAGYFTFWGKKPPRSLHTRAEKV